MSTRRRAFTLIELLIVVAIIGVLAAIAVPNFINAQTRAKVAKVKSDFKAIYTAQEMYYLDNNNYAPPFKLQALTSPLSYIANVPQDVFPPRHILKTGGGQGEAYAAVTWYRYVYGTPVGVKPVNYAGGNSGGGLRIALCADHYAYFEPFLLRGPAEAMAGQKDCSTQWLVKSFGTNVNMSALCGNNGDDCTFRYDPTNGLISIGDIAIFGPGGMTE
ncbi:MAG: prepilin-type N-terminal cleavage/methylation domain-containing protein [Candidatus Omnitrophota bacterium]